MTAFVQDELLARETKDIIARLLSSPKTHHQR